MYDKLKEWFRCKHCWKWRNSSCRVESFSHDYFKSCLLQRHLMSRKILRYLEVRFLCSVKSIVGIEDKYWADSPYPSLVSKVLICHNLFRKVICCRCARMCLQVGKSYIFLKPRAKRLKISKKMTHLIVRNSFIAPCRCFLYEIFLKSSPSNAILRKSPLKMSELNPSSTEHLESIH